MCLKKPVDAVLLAKLPKTGAGWKCFKTIDGKPGYLSALVLGHGPYSVVAWNVDTDVGFMHAENGERYRTGFHVCLDKAGADQIANAMNFCRFDGELYVTRKVEWADPMAFGEEGNLPGAVVVARRMKIVEEETNVGNDRSQA